MNTRLIDKKIRYMFGCVLILLLVPAASLIYAADVMENYCIVPPYVTRDIAPNIMIMMDNSSDMMNPAYTGAYTPNATKDNYIGYFKPQACYYYDGSKFAEVYSAWTSTTRTSFTYADSCNTSGFNEIGNVQTGVYRGNLMNWATMSKYDVLQKVIIGGNTVSKQGNAHTLLAIEGSWPIKSYGGCDFHVMSNGNMTISDTPSGGGCSLIASSPLELVSVKDPNGNLEIASNNNKEDKNAGALSKADRIYSVIDTAAKKIFASALWIWDRISIVSEAEAAACTYSVGTKNGTVGTLYNLIITVPKPNGNGASTTWSMTTTPSFFSSSAPVTNTGSQNSTATWSGTPTSSGTYHFNVTLSQTGNSSSTCGPTTISGDITISCPSTAQIITTSLNNGTIGSAYSFIVTGIGGIAPYTWSASGLPANLSIDPLTGVISGSPTVCGDFSPTITFTDDASGSCQSTVSRTFTLHISSTVQINTSALSPGSAGTPYSFTLNGQGGSTPYTWSATGLPTPHLSLTGGVISGLPTAADVGTYTVVVTLTDSSGCSVTKSFTLNITSTPLALQIVTLSLPNGVKGQPYSYYVQGAGGTLPYTWSATFVPNLGLFSMDPITGLISGSPTSTGASTVTITLKDGTGATVSKTFTLTVTRLLNSQAFNIKVVLVEEPLSDLNGNDIYDPGSGETFTDTNGNGVWDGKQGVFQKYWDIINPKARWGLTSYAKQGYVDLPMSGCIPASPASSFYTQIQNVQPSTSFPLADGLYGDINYFGFNATNFSQYDSNSYQGCGNSDPIDSTPCRKNFVLIISSGANLTSTAFSTNPDGSAFSFSSAGCLNKNGNVNNPLVKDACYGSTNDMRSDKAGRQTVLTYTVNTMGTAAAGAILEDAALAGGGKYYDASNIANLERQLDQAFKDMLGRAASGTAASVLASGEGSGANLIQAVYYPTKKFGFDEIGWIGRLTNLWYFVDPNLNNSNIREDAGVDNGDGTFGPGDKVLTLQTDNGHNDHIVQLFFDTTAEVTKAHRWADADGNAVIDATPALPDLNFESIGNLWEAGGLLWSRTATRVIYTTTGSALIPFTEANKTTLRPYLQAASDDQSQSIIRYMNGVDTPYADLPAYTYRPRSVSINGTGPYTWKLGDILNSTPKISSWLPLNMYHKLYKDNSYGVPGSDPSLQNGPDPTHYITSSTYQGRGMIFAGANDGMLHAFKLGTLELKWSGMGNYDQARLTGTGLGEESWAFIPKNALPYLKYTADLSYCHVYTVDLTPFIFDASIGRPATCDPLETDSSKCVRAPDSWRTIVIGGMRYGGGCKKTCSDTDCVSTPTTDPADATKGLGYSSYFALDITDQNNPILLWEFTHEQLGFSTTGPAILRESVTDASNTPLPLRNGKWFVVFGSGPTGPISASDNQFLAHSDQSLKLFILDLAKPAANAWTLNTNYWVKDTTIPNAFAGSLLNSTMDTDLDYQDDVMYIPYVKEATDLTWTDGGVLRLSTKQNTNPANWVVSTLMDGIGPVTSSVAKLQNKTSRALWTFFGAGRYFYVQGGVADDATNQGDEGGSAPPRRRIIGVKDPCLDHSTGLFLPNCTTQVSISDPNVKDVTNVTNVEQNPDTNTSYKGWFIWLDADHTSSGVPDATVRAERVITDPLAATSGVVFFTTYKPFSDQCSMGGTSSIWAVKYNTGGDASSLLKGQALIQVSTGSIEQLKLSDAFKDSVTGLNTGNRKSAQMQGVPPMQQGLSILGTPPPVKRVLHIKER